MTKPAQGRPSIYTPAIAEEICRRIASGESLRAVCTSDHMPDESTVRQWVLEDREGFSPQYARACETRAEGWADEIVSIADTAEDPQKARLQVDARKWVVSKMLPKFGDKMQVSGVIAQFDPTKLSESQLRRIADGEDPASVLAGN